MNYKTRSLPPGNPPPGTATVGLTSTHSVISRQCGDAHLLFHSRVWSQHVWADVGFRACTLHIGLVPGHLGSPQVTVYSWEDKIKSFIGWGLGLMLGMAIATSFGPTRNKKMEITLHMPMLAPRVSSWKQLEIIIQKGSGTVQAQNAQPMITL